MRFPESRLCGLVAGKAKRRRRLYQQVSFVGIMRTMADAASVLFYGFMDDLSFVGLPVVALIAEVRSLRLQEMAPPGSMRIMTGDASGGFQSGMQFRLIEQDRFLAVAGVTYLVPDIFQ